MDLSQLYTIPPWTAFPPCPFQFQVICKGTVLELIDSPSRQVMLIGSSPLCDIHPDHPSISRTHAILQCSHKGVHIYDLNSKNGTFINGTKQPAHCYQMLQPYDQIRFGFSDKIFLYKMLEDQRPQKTSFLQMIQQKPFNYKELKQTYLSMLDKKRAPYEPTKSQEEECDGISWGMQNDHDIYRSARQSQYEIHADLLRKLPNLSDEMLRLIGKHEKLESKSESLKNKLEKAHSKEDHQKLSQQLLQQQNKLIQSQDTLRAVLFEQGSSLSPQHQQEKQQTISYQQTKQNLLMRRQILQEELRSLEQSSTVQEAADSLDEFMCQNNEQVKKEHRIRLLNELENLQTKLQTRPIQFLFQMPQKKYQQKKPDLTRLEKVLHNIDMKTVQESTNPLATLKRPQIVQKTKSFDPCPNVEQLIGDFEPGKAKVGFRFGVAQKQPERDQKESQCQMEIQDLTEL